MREAFAGFIFLLAVFGWIWPETLGHEVRHHYDEFMKGWNDDLQPRH
jgi:hypothetical protein